MQQQFLFSYQIRSKRLEDEPVKPVKAAPQKTAAAPSDSSKPATKDMIPDSDENEPENEEEAIDNESKKSEEEEEEDEEESNPPRVSSSTPVTVEYPIGSRLKIKYGKGKTSKVYDAKVRFLFSIHFHIQFQSSTITNYCGNYPTMITL